VLVRRDTKYWSILMPDVTHDLRYVACTLQEALEEPRWFCTAVVQDKETDEILSVNYDYLATTDPTTGINDALADDGIYL